MHQAEETPRKETEEVVGRRKSEQFYNVIKATRRKYFKKERVIKGTSQQLVLLNSGERKWGLEGVKEEEDLLFTVCLLYLSNVVPGAYITYSRHKYNNLEGGGRAE